VKVTDQGHYVTSASLIEGASTIRLNRNGIWSEHLGISKILPESNLAILSPRWGNEAKTTTSISPWLNPKNGQPAIPVENQTLVAIGYPQNLFELHASVGKLSHFESSDNGMAAGRLIMPSDAGLEGAPIFNRRGQLVGISHIDGPKNNDGTAAASSGGMISLPTRSLVEALREITSRNK